MNKAKPIGFGYNTPSTLPIGTLRTISGASPLTLPHALPRSPKKLTIHGNTIDGLGVGDYNEASGLFEIPVTIRGINLLDTTRERTVISGSLPGGEYTAGVGTLSFSTAYYSSSNIYGIKTAVKPNTSYVLTYKTITGRALIRLFSESGSTITTYNSTGDFVFNSRSNSTIYIEFRSNSWNLYTELTDIILSEAAAASYEPYAEPVQYTLYSEHPIYMGEHIDADPGKLIKGTNIIEVNTLISPTLIECAYYSR